MLQGLHQGSSSELRTSSVTLLRAASAARLPAGLTWLTVGDWGRGGESGQRAVAQHMAKWASATASAFIVSTGDNFYPAGLGSFHIHSRRASCRKWQICSSATYMTLPSPPSSLSRPVHPHSFLQPPPWTRSSASHGRQCTVAEPCRQCRGTLSLATTTGAGRTCPFHRNQRVAQRSAASLPSPTRGGTSPRYRTCKRSRCRTRTRHSRHWDACEPST